MTRRVAEVHQPALGEQENFVAVRERVLIDLRFDIGPLHAFAGVERVDLNFVVEVTMFATTA